jgi:hypothetical protein
MISLPTTFGLLHLPSKRFARFDNVERSVFHRLKPDLSQTTYRDEENELSDRAEFYEASALSTVLKIQGVEFDRSDFGEIDDGYGRLVILDDFSKFIPVAFTRQASRLHGVGDYIPSDIKARLVVDIEDDGDVYALADIPA